MITSFRVRAKWIPHFVSLRYLRYFRISSTRFEEKSSAARDAQHSSSRTSRSPPPLSPPKAPVRSKLWAFAVGGSVALAYAAYRRNRTPQQAKLDSVDGFTKYTLVDKDDISTTCSIFTIAPVAGKSAVIGLTEHPRSVQSLLVKQPDLQIARSYTILPPVTESVDGSIRLLIRKETNGEVSTYLHDVQVGSDIEIRGPYSDLTFPNDTSNVIFLAGGTGIAPALKTAELLQNTANVNILWASRRTEDCRGGSSDHPEFSLISNAKSLFGLGIASLEATPKEKNTLVLLLDILRLQASAHEKQLTVDYFADDQHSYIRPRDVIKLVNAADRSPGSNLIVVSGPDGFVSYWAGAKRHANEHQEQGQIGGVLSKLDLNGWQVIKL